MEDIRPKLRRGISPTPATAASRRPANRKPRRCLA